MEDLRLVVPDYKRYMGKNVQSIKEDGGGGGGGDDSSIEVQPLAI